MREDPNKVTYFAETDRRQKIPFGIKAADRSKHVYVIGKTGMGKSTLLENMAIQDIKNGNGMAFVDPHGKTAELLLEYIPESRIKDVIYFAPFDMEHPMSFNIMEDVGYDKRHLVANGLMSAFKKIWVDAWSARMEYILNNVILALLEYPDSTLLGVNRMLTDKVYRKKVVDNITDPSTKSFWVDEFAKYTDRYTQEATPAIQNKVGQFTANPLIRNIIGQPKSSFDMRQVMDEKKILIINLSKGRIGEGNANLLGSMLITKLYLAAMSRADKQETELRKLPNFYLYVDEFQSFANESFADILSEARKYKLNLTIAHQYIEQMPEEVRSAVFGNVGTMIVFRVGAYDADVLEKEFAPKFFADDLVNLGFTQIYLKLMIDGVSSHPFSAVTLPPIMPPEKSSRDIVIQNSRKIYAKPRAEVQKEIEDWYANSVVVNSPVKKESPVAPQKQGNNIGNPNTANHNNNNGNYNIANHNNAGNFNVANHNNNHTVQNHPASFSTPRPSFKSSSFQNKPVLKPVRQEYPKEKEQELIKTINEEVDKRLLEKPFFPQMEKKIVPQKPLISELQKVTSREAVLYKNVEKETDEDGGENYEEEKISLSELKEEVRRIQRPKESENLSTLKNTLRSVLEKESKTKESLPVPVKREENNSRSVLQKEVPEDVLQKVLKMENDE